jgi:Na+/pantothenate symporter
MAPIAASGATRSIDPKRRLVTEPALLSISMLAVLALTLGGGWSVARRADKKQGVLMLVAAAVLLANVLIWAWPGGH